MDKCITACEDMNIQDNKYDVLIVNLSKEIKELCETTTAKLLFYDGKVAELCTYIKANLTNSIQCLLADMKFSGELDDIINNIVITTVSKLEYDVHNLKHKTVGITTPQMFGAVGDGICDDTEAINQAIKTGKPIIIPNGTYRITKISDIDNLMLFGMNKESVKIIVTEYLGFSNIDKVNIEGITFISEVPQHSILFKNDTKTMSGIIKNCQFEDFNCVVLMEAYGNSLTVKNCYFKNGVNGVELNYAHNCHIDNNIFWQQSNHSIKLMRGSGSTVTNNNIVATNEKPSVFYFLSQMCTVSNNYYENYDKTGNKNECFILVEYNKFTQLPKFVGNLINGDNALLVGIKFQGTGINENALIIENNSIFSCDNSLEIEKSHFSTLHIKNNAGIPDVCGKRYYYSCVDVTDLEEGNRTIEIDNGTVSDDFNLSTGNNTIKPYTVNKRYMLRVRGEAEATNENSGIILKLRTTNGVCLKSFVINTSNTGLHSIGDLILFDIPTASNTAYRVDYENIAGTPLFSSLRLFVELKEM